MPIVRRTLDQCQEKTGDWFVDRYIIERRKKLRDAGNVWGEPEHPDGYWPEGYAKITLNVSVNFKTQLYTNSEGTQLLSLSFDVVDWPEIVNLSRSRTGSFREYVKYPPSIRERTGIEGEYWSLYWQNPHQPSMNWRRRAFRVKIGGAALRGGRRTRA